MCYKIVIFFSLAKASPHNTICKIPLNDSFSTISAKWCQKWSGRISKGSNYVSNGVPRVEIISGGV